MAKAASPNPASSHAAPERWVLAAQLRCEADPVSGEDAGQLNAGVLHSDQAKSNSLPADEKR